jgi:3-methylfumaryl-CoA hydratase
MKITAAQIADWTGHVGRVNRLEQRLDIESLRRFSAACGFSCDVESMRPPLAHWAWFLPTVCDAELGFDGHPKRGGFLPAVTLPRRMFGGATMSFAAPLQLDAAAELEMRVASVAHRAGRSGDLVFVEVDRVISQSGEVRIQERQTIVYCEAGGPLALPEVVAPAAADSQWRPGLVDLFRFSAVTFNSHRIHYDRRYAIEEEGYPALVVPGPFTAVKLAAFAQAKGERPLASFQFKAMSPLFVDQPVEFQADLAARTFNAIRCDGIAAMTSLVAYKD